MGFNAVRWIKQTARSAGLEKPLKAIYTALGIGHARKKQAKAVEDEFRAKYGHRLKHQVEVAGLKAIFSTEDDWSKHFFFPKFEFQVFEERVTRLFLDELAGKRCCVDIGCNIGWFTCLAALKLPEATVVGVDLDDHNVQVSRKNVALNGLKNAEIIHAALTNRSGTVQYRPRPLLSSDAHRIANSQDLKSDGDLVSVPAIRMDELFENRPVQPDIVKIDVQGAELHVLQGMTRILSESRPVLFLELHPTELPGFGATTEQVLDLLSSAGYELRELCDMRESGAELKSRTVDARTRFVDTTMIIAKPK